MSDYDFRPGGSLKLKKSHAVIDGGIKKKKKKDKSKRKEKEKEEDAAAQTSSAEIDDVPSSSNSKGASETAKTTGLTEAERRFEEIRRRRMEDRVKQLAKQTHKERVHEFNAKLEALSEHHDIPKVGPG